MLVAGATRGAAAIASLPDRAVDSALSQAERCPAEAEVARSKRARARHRTRRGHGRAAG